MRRFSLHLDPPSTGVRYILLATLLFAVMNVGVKLLVGFPVHEIVFFRALVTLVVGYGLLRRAGISPWGHNRPLLVARGVAGTVALVCYFWSLHQMPLGSAVTIQHLSPIFTVAISGLLLREPPRAVQWVFFAGAFAGVVMVKGFDPRVTLFELTIGIGAAASAGLAYNLVRMLKDHDHPLVVVFYFPLVTVPVIGAYTLGHWTWPTALQWLLLLIVGLSTTGAQVYLTRAFQLDRASNISIFNYLGIVLAIFVGWLAFSEPLGPLTLIGVLVIMVCVVGGGLYNSRRKT